MLLKKLISTLLEPSFMVDAKLEPKVIFKNQKLPNIGIYQCCVGVFFLIYPKIRVYTKFQFIYPISKCTLWKKKPLT